MFFRKSSNGPQDLCTHIMNDCAEFDDRLSRIAQDKERKIGAAMEFWSHGQTKLADKHIEAIARVDIIELDAAEQMQRLNRINSLGQAALLQQSDTRWGERVTDAALTRLHQSSRKIRHDVASCMR